MDILDTLVGFVTNFTSAMNLGIPPTTLTLPRNTWHNHKRSSLFSPMIDVTNENSKVIIETMDI
jgi:hypothetical protein